MADITARKAGTDRQDGEVLSFKMNAEEIFEGAFVALDTDGYATNAGDDAGAVFVGVAEESVDNSGGSDGDVNIKVRTGGVISCVAGFSAAQANVGDEVFAEDNQTVDVAGGLTNDVYVGRIVEVVSSSKVRVALTPYGAKTSDAT